MGRIRWEGYGSKKGYKVFGKGHNMNFKRFDNRVYISVDDLFLMLTTEELASKNFQGSEAEMNAARIVGLAYGALRESLKETVSNLKWPW